MTKTLINKAFASMTALFAAAAMAVPTISAYAANGTTLDTPGTSTTFNISKDIVLFNVDGSKIYEPNVVYDYSIAPVTIDGRVTITDENENVVAVRSGIANAVTIKGNAADAAYDSTASLTFGVDTKTDTNDEGATVTNTSKRVDEELGIKIDAAVIYGTGETHNPPGVYRYKLSDETTTASLEEAGITRNADYDEDIYLDVYTKLNENGDGLVVYGYTLFKSSTEEGSENTSVTTSTNKVTGYDVESETKTIPDSTDTEIISDQYHTYNVEIKKTVTGSLGNKDNEFPFQIVLTNDTVKSAADFYWIQTGETEKQASVASTVTLGTAAASSDIYLKNGDTCLITGLPAGTKVQVTEFNNTGDTYTVSVEHNGTALDLDAATDKKSVKAAASQTAGMLSTGDVDKTESKDIIVFENNLEDISVTGLLFSIAPFAFIAAAGAALLGLFMRNKKNSNTEDRI